jgi:hypothetical protein
VRAHSLQVASGKRPVAAKTKERERRAAVVKVPPVDPLKVAAGIRSGMELVTADGEVEGGGELDEAGAERGSAGDEVEVEEEEEEEEEALGDLEWIGQDGSEPAEARAAREERGRREKDRVDRAMLKEEARQEQVRWGTRCLDSVDNIKTLARLVASSSRPATPNKEVTKRGVWLTRETEGLSPSPLT